MSRQPQDHFAAALAHQLQGPISTMQAAATNIRRNLRGMLEDLGTMATPPVPAGMVAAFVSRAIDDPAPRPLTGLLPQDRIEVMARRLRDAGVDGDLEGFAAILLRGGWDTDIDTIARMLAADPATVVEILDSAARLRGNLAAIDDSLRCVKGLASTLGMLGLPGVGPAVDLKRGIEHAAAALELTIPEGVTIAMHLDELPPARGGQELLEAVWANLLGNAIRAVGDTGTVTIEGEAAGRGSMSRAIIRIIDDGPGIPAAALSRLFEPLYTAPVSSGGSGLGLAIARHIVQGLDGDITVDSRPGRTCFTVTLPAARVPEIQRR